MLYQKYYPNYSSKNFLLKDSFVTIRHEVLFDLRKWVDEENTRVLELSFEVSVDSLIGKELDLIKDSSLLSYHYGVTSIWSGWGNDLSNQELFGTINVLKYDEKRMVIKYNLRSKEDEIFIKGKVKIPNQTND